MLSPLSPRSPQKPSADQQQILRDVNTRLEGIKAECQTLVDAKNDPSVITDQNLTLSPAGPQSDLREELNITIPSSLENRITVVHMAISDIIRDTEPGSALQFCKDENLSLVEHMLQDTGSTTQSSTTTSPTSTNVPTDQTSR